MQYYTMALDTYSPDVFFVSCSASSNCEILRDMLWFHSVIKLVVVPVDQLIPPPIEYAADGRHCSLSAVVTMLSEWYDLVAVRPDGQAVFLLKSIHHRTRDPTYASTFDHWLRGWFCDPASDMLQSVRDEYASILPYRDIHPSVKASILGLHPSLVTVSAEDVGTDSDWMYTSLQSTKSMRLAESRGRAHCHHGLCDCIPPYRGHLCLDVVTGGKNDTVIYYLTSNKSSDLHDLNLSLTDLATHVPDIEYPVIVFYDAPFPTTTKARIAMSAPALNIWFVSQFFTQHQQVAPDSIPHHYRPIGYRQVCRFEAGPVFLHPAMLRFNFTVRLDTDGYFPRAVSGDPFAVIRDPMSPPLMFSGLINVPGNRLNGLLDVLTLYVQSEGINSDLLSSITDITTTSMVSINNPPYMFKNEFFRSPEYMRFYHFIDSGFGFYDRGFLGNSVLTAGAVLLGEAGHIPNLPWAHGPHCDCAGMTCQPARVNTEWMKHQQTKWICV